MLSFYSQIQEKELAVKERYKKIKGKSQELITNWEDKSRDFITGFIEMFGRDNMMVHFFLIIFTFL